METRDLKSKGKEVSSQVNQIINSPSEATIYEPAIKKVNHGKRVSSSSEEGDSSDIRETDTSDKGDINDAINTFVGQHRLELDERERDRRRYEERHRPDFRRREGTDHNRHQRQAEENAAHRLKRAERGKEHIHEVSGKEKELCINEIDQDFMILAAHVDEVTAKKIAIGEYINFSRLIPKDKITLEEDHRLEMVQKGGSTYWIPAADKEQTVISNVEKWDQAFRVYSKIYVKYNPSRGQELVEYAFLIHSTAGIFAWSNVYTYDKLFRMHIAKHPKRNWGIILQQAWSFCLMEKNGNQNQTNYNGRGSDENRRKSSKICFKYNQGRCPYGFNCKFEHKCGICGKYGHGASTCRRLTNFDRDGKRGRDDYERNKEKDKPFQRKDFIKGKTN